MFLRRGFFAAAVIFGLVLPAHAAVLFDNNPTNSTSGGNNPEAQGFYVAQNFSLSQASTLNSFFFNAFTSPATVPITSVNLNIYTSVNNAPGTLLDSGTFQVASQVVTGNNGFVLKDFGIDLPSWQLGAGTYFVALNVLPSQWDMHWTISYGSPLPGNSYISGNGVSGTFSTYQFDHDFRFEDTAIGAVPEPSTWAMMILGFAGVGYMACRRRKPAAALTAA